MLSTSLPVGSIVSRITWLTVYENPPCFSQNTGDFSKKQWSSICRLGSFAQPLGGRVMAGGGRALNQRTPCRGIGGRAATFAQTQPIPEETVGKVLRRRRTEVTKGERLVERQMPAEEMAPPHHTCGQRIVRFGCAVQEAEREGKGFGIGIVRE